jgi:hypothetical protein
MPAQFSFGDFLLTYEHLASKLWREQATMHPERERSCFVAYDTLPLSSEIFQLAMLWCDCGSQPCPISLELGHSHVQTEIP